jgi:hypothetical protein
VKDREDYKAILGLDPGVLDWAAKIRRGELTETQALAQLLASEEFYGRSGRTPAGFAERLAGTVFGSRRPLAPPTADLETPAGRLALADGLLSGPTREEYHRRLVADLYKLLLDRPEPLELLVLNMATGEFVDRGMFEALRALNDGTPPERVRAEIVASPAFLEKAGRTSEGFVRRIYETLLFRGATLPEVDYWSGVIDAQLAALALPDLAAAPQVRRDVAAQFLAKPEPTNFVVARWYSQYLGRKPGWPGYADSIYNWGGTIEPEFSEIPSIGPGFEVKAPRTPLQGRSPGRCTLPRRLGDDPGEAPPAVDRPHRDLERVLRGHQHRRGPGERAAVPRHDARLRRPVPRPLRPDRSTPPASRPARRRAGRGAGGDVCKARSSSSTSTPSATSWSRPAPCSSPAPGRSCRTSPA